MACCAVVVIGDISLYSQYHVAPAPSLEVPYVVIKRTGLGSLSLGGMKDKSIFPVGRQITIVRDRINLVVSILLESYLRSQNIAEGFSISSTDVREIERRDLL